MYVRLDGQVCRREGKELLSFIERLAGTAKLKEETEKVHDTLDDSREEALSLELQETETLQRRKQLQPQARPIQIEAPSVQKCSYYCRA